MCTMNNHIFKAHFWCFLENVYNCSAIEMSVYSISKITVKYAFFVIYRRFLRVESIVLAFCRGYWF